MVGIVFNDVTDILSAALNQKQNKFTTLEPSVSQV